MNKNNLKKLRHNTSDEMFETIVRDGTGRQLARWKVGKKDYPRALKSLNEQFGLGIRIIKVGTPEDLDWLKDS